MIATTVGLVCQALLLLALAPAVNGVIKRAKAGWQMRQGPPIWQGYLDSLKWVGKQTVWPAGSSWVSRAAPLVSALVTVVAGLAVPMVVRAAPLQGAADLLVVIGLLGLARLVTALGGLDSGSAFGGMGSSREMSIAALVEPVFLLALLVLALPAGTTNLSALAASTPGISSAGGALAAAALFIVTIAETGRIPVDNPDTHLELTMIHEAMVLEASGPQLALIHWTAALKQLILLSLLAALFVPWGSAAPTDGVALVAVSSLLFVLKVLGLGLGLAAMETAFAKAAIFRVPDLLGLGAGLALLGLAAQAVLHG